MKVCIDIGHCPSAPGAENRNYNISEYRFWSTYASRLANYLRRYGHDAVIVNREMDGCGTGMTACVRTRYNANLPLDIISVTQALADMRQLDAVGGNAGLAALYTFTTTGGFFEHYLHTLRDKFLLRSVIDTSSRAITDAFSGPEDVEALMDAAETHLFQIREQARSRADGPGLAALVREAVPALKILSPARGAFRGFPRGLASWTRRVTALSRGTCS